MNNFGIFLAQKRREAGLTQKQLAEKLYVSESTISKWEKNKANPDISIISELSSILNVTEHELLSASVDKEERKKSVYARRWKTLSFTWNLFFIISYGITLLTCFIVNLAGGKTLDWFFIVLTSIILASTFTTVPRYISKYKLLIVPLSQLLALFLLFGVCCIYTSGTWFILATVPTCFAFLLIFLPIFLKHYIPNFKHTAIVSVSVDIISLLAMLFIINTVENGSWFFIFALPLTLYCSVIPLIFVLVIRYTNLEKLLKSSILTFIFIPFCIIAYFIVNGLLSSVFGLEKEVINLPNFSAWNTDTMISSNVCFLVLIAILLASIIQLILFMINKKRKVN